MSRRNPLRANIIEINVFACDFLILDAAFCVLRIPTEFICKFATITNSYTETCKHKTKYGFSFDSCSVQPMRT